MPEQVHWIIALLAGMVLGAFFFGGLWWTVRRLQTFQNPALLFLGSLLLRMAVVLLGLYVVGAGHWDRMVIALVGIVLARFIVLRITKSKETNVQPSAPHSDGA